MYYHNRGFTSRIRAMHVAAPLASVALRKPVFTVVVFAPFAPLRLADVLLDMLRRVISRAAFARKGARRGASLNGIIQLGSYFPIPGLDAFFPSGRRICLPALPAVQGIIAVNTVVPVPLLQATSADRAFPPCMFIDPSSACRLPMLQ